MNFNVELLNSLLKKYENSLKNGTASKRRKIALNTDKSKVFAKYHCDNAFDIRPEIEESVKEIENLGFVFCKRNCAELLEVELNYDKINEIYEYLGKELPEIALGKHLSFLQDLERCENCMIAQKYLEFNIDLAKKFSDIHENEIERNINAINEICREKDEILLRNFSKKVFNDSKTFEKLGSVFLTLFNRFGEIIFENFEDLCFYYNIVTTPTFINLKGNVEVVFCNGSKINIADFQYGIGICAKDINKLDKIIVHDDELFTIENYTKYLSFNKTNATIVYLAGYHNNDKNIFLQKIYAGNNHLKYFHYGDIDYGGINIYNNLKAKSEMPFQMYNMDIETMLTHKNYWSKLSNNDQINLKRLKEKFVEHGVLIDFMLENNCKLEQEAIYDMDNLIDFN